MGKQRVNTFAPQMSAINDCPHLLRCGVNTFAPQMSAINGCPHLFAVWGQHICSANASHKWLSASLAVWGVPNSIRSQNSFLTRKSGSFKALSRWDSCFILLSTRQSLERNETLTTGWRFFRHPASTKPHGFVLFLLVWIPFFMDMLFCDTIPHGFGWDTYFHLTAYLL